MTELAHVPSSPLAIAGGQEFWSDKQLAALKQIGVDRASNGDLAVFMHVCQRTGLDPFARQIFMIERQGKQVIQTGIDGMRLVARRAVDRAGESLSISGAIWCGPDGVWTDVWVSDRPPAAARVTVTRGGGEFTAVVLFEEYAQRKRDGELTQMWATRPAGQLAKCAEALALRKACPQDLSGVYSDDELARDTRPATVSAVAQAVHHEPEPTVAPGMLDPRSSKGRHMFAALGSIDVTDKANRLAYVSGVVGRPITTSAELTEAEADEVIEAAEAGLWPVRVDGEIMPDPADGADPWVTA